MPKFKKQPKNNFYFFMMERKAELEARGYRFPAGMKDVASAVAGEWKDLPAADRERFNVLAKEAKEQEKDNFENKFTCSGESYAAMNRRLAAGQAEKVALKEMFQEVVHVEQPEERIFVLMHAIPSCIVGLDNLTESKEYYPLEIAATAFSLKDGLICSFWSLINTMSVPCGYASEAKDTSDETCLPQPGSKMFNEIAPDAVNYNRIMTNIRTFVETWCDGYPKDKYMVFAMDENIKKLRGCIDWLQKNADENVVANTKFFEKLKIYSLAQMIIELAVLGNQMNPEYRSELQQFRLVPSATNLLATGCYDYREEITCAYHNQEEYSKKMHSCCKNYILRRVFIIFEEFCDVFSCPLSGRHNINDFSKTPIPEHLRQRAPNRSSSSGPTVSSCSPAEVQPSRPERGSTRGDDGTSSARESSRSGEKSRDSSRHQQGSDRSRRERSVDLIEVAGSTRRSGKDQRPRGSENGQLHSGRRSETSSSGYDRRRRESDSNDRDRRNGCDSNNESRRSSSQRHTDGDNERSRDRDPDRSSNRDGDYRTRDSGRSSSYRQADRDRSYNNGEGGHRSNQDDGRSSNRDAERNRNRDSSERSRDRDSEGSSDRRTRPPTSSSTVEVDLEEDAPVRTKDRDDDLSYYRRGAARPESLSGRSGEHSRPEQNPSRNDSAKRGDANNLSYKIPSWDAAPAESRHSTQGVSRQEVSSRSYQSRDIEDPWSDRPSYSAGRGRRLNEREPPPPVYDVSVSITDDNDTRLEFRQSYERRKRKRNGSASPQPPSPLSGAAKAERLDDSLGYSRTSTASTSHDPWGTTPMKSPERPLSTDNHDDDPWSVPTPRGRGRGFRIISSSPDKIPPAPGPRTEDEPSPPPQSRPTGRGYRASTFTGW